MTTPGDIERTRAANHSRLWIGFGVALMVCAIFCLWVIQVEEEAQMAAMRRARPGVTICFAADPLKDIKLGVCWINTLAGLGFIVRGAMIRPPDA